MMLAILACMKCGSLSTLPADKHNPPAVGTIIDAVCGIQYGETSDHDEFVCDGAVICRGYVTLGIRFLNGDG